MLTKRCLIPLCILSIFIFSIPTISKAQGKDRNCCLITDKVKGVSFSYTEKKALCPDNLEVSRLFCEEPAYCFDSASKLISTEVSTAAKCNSAGHSSLSAIFFANLNSSIKKMACPLIEVTSGNPVELTTKCAFEYLKSQPGFDPKKNLDSAVKNFVQFISKQIDDAFARTILKPLGLSNAELYNKNLPNDLIPNKLAAKGLDLKSDQIIEGFSPIKKLESSIIESANDESASFCGKDIFFKTDIEQGLIECCDEAVGPLIKLDGTQSCKCNEQALCPNDTGKGYANCCDTSKSEYCHADSEGRHSCESKKYCGKEEYFQIDVDAGRIECCDPARGPLIKLDGTQSCECNEQGLCPNDTGKGYANCCDTSKSEYCHADSEGRHSCESKKYCGKEEYFQIDVDAGRIECCDPARGPLIKLDGTQSCECNEQALCPNDTGKGYANCCDTSKSEYCHADSEGRHSCESKKYCGKEEYFQIDVDAGRIECCDPARGPLIKLDGTQSCECNEQGLCPNDTGKGYANCCDTSKSEYCHADSEGRHSCESKKYCGKEEYFQIDVDAGRIECCDPARGPLIKLDGTQSCECNEQGLCPNDTGKGYANCCDTSKSEYCHADSEGRHSCESKKYCGKEEYFQIDVDAGRIECCDPARGPLIKLDGTQSCKCNEQALCPNDTGKGSANCCDIAKGEICNTDSAGKHSCEVKKFCGKQEYLQLDVDMGLIECCDPARGPLIKLDGTQSCKCNEQALCPNDTGKGYANCCDTSKSEYCHADSEGRHSCESKKYCGKEEYFQIDVDAGRIECCNEAVGPLIKLDGTQSCDCSEPAVCPNDTGRGQAICCDTNKGEYCAKEDGEHFCKERKLCGQELYDPLKFSCCNNKTIYDSNVNECCLNGAVVEMGGCTDPSLVPLENSKDDPLSFPN